VNPVNVFHCSDLHFGPPAIPEQHEALLKLISERRFDVVAISGDLTQRARTKQFMQARAFIDEAGQASKVIVVPGNHDVAWWFAPLGIGARGMLLAKYRRYISRDVQPVLRVPGTTFVGINTAHGISFGTLTTRLKDLSIIGWVSEQQLARAAAEFDRSPAGDARVVVLHHNTIRGALSQRHGLSNTTRVNEALGQMHVDLVLCGHDHQEAIHNIEHPTKTMTISTAGTVSNRGRGGRPSSANSIHISPKSIEIQTLIWSDRTGSFVDGPAQSFPR
jgi:3',5'-cyclic AMP phosphodiesterase CpdA